MSQPLFAKSSVFLFWWWGWEREGAAEGGIKGLTVGQNTHFTAWPRGYTTFFMLNSAEHEIFNAHKYKNIKKFSFFRLR